MRLGRDGEDAAAAYLASLGLLIVGRNVRGPAGEIDIVAREGKTIVFVEVKARRSHRFGSALGAVDARKRKRLRAAAADYLQFVAPCATARFDVLTIDGAVMRLYRGAFA
ncbi:MAG: YraN family protein [Candidatus Eremiobacteraeota bacterium]|nr:YraN family protein [Candidatus Eremiobacteraeota bacterium]MBC5803045.1 YraN family protein [Candidatus Eremiobacteraeota bacterium]MBC5821414.1 YraN family protein [Candidatus Eremiobacteraeota bacterium]